MRKEEKKGKMDVEVEKKKNTLPSIVSLFTLSSSIPALPLQEERDPNSPNAERLPAVTFLLCIFSDRPSADCSCSSTAKRLKKKKKKNSRRKMLMASTALPSAAAAFGIGRPCRAQPLRALRNRACTRSLLVRCSAEKVRKIRRVEVGGIGVF